MEPYEGRLAEKVVKHLMDSACPSPIPQDSLLSLIRIGQNLVKWQPMELSAPRQIVGNINGNFNNLKNIFDTFGWPSVQKYLFLGDYVDVGERQIDTLALLLALKTLHPESLFLIRGQHETSELNIVGGFREECERLGYGLQVYQNCIKLFDHMKMSAVIGDRIFCVNDIPKGLHSLDRLAQIPRLLQIQPDQLDSTKVNCWQFHQDGNSFDPEVVKKFCRDHSFDRVVRSHQVCPNGYEISADEMLVTICSAPNLGGAGNYAAVMTVNEDFGCEVQRGRFVQA